MQRTIIAALIAMLALSACATYPYGMSESEWTALPQEEQVRLREQYASEQAEKRRQAELKKQQEQARIDALYANARYGDVVQCALNGGRARIYGDWQKYEPTAFRIIATDSKQVVLKNHDGGYGEVEFFVSYKAGGVMRFCEYEGDSSFNDCSSITLIDKELERGAQKRVSLDGLLKGVEVSCGYEGVRPGLFLGR